MMRRGRGYKAVANRYTRERALTLVKEEVDARLLGKRLEGECRLWLRNETGERKEVVLLYLNPGPEVWEGERVLTFEREVERGRKGTSGITWDVSP